jgi:hypothetical protein
MTALALFAFYVLAQPHPETTELLHCYFLPCCCPACAQAPWVMDDNGCPCAMCHALSATCDAPDLALRQPLRKGS